MKTTTIDKKKAAIIATIALAAAVAIALLAVSCTAEADGETKPSSITAIEIESQEDASEAEQDGDTEDAAGDNAVQADESAAESSNTDTEPAHDAAAAQPHTNATRASASSDEPSSSSGNASSSAPTPAKRWVEDTQQVWVEDRAAWTEQVPIYSSKEVSICNVCGADITGNTAAHSKAHMMAGEGSGHHSEVQKIVTGYNSVNHPAEGHYETKVVGGHWE